MPCSVFGVRMCLGCLGRRATELVGGCCSVFVCWGCCCCPCAHHHGSWRVLLHTIHHVPSLPSQPPMLPLTPPPIPGPAAGGLCGSVCGGSSAGLSAGVDCGAGEGVAVQTCGGSMLHLLLCAAGLGAPVVVGHPASFALCCWPAGVQGLRLQQGLTAHLPACVHTHCIIEVLEPC